jgi:hypothetical protein
LRQPDHGKHAVGGELGTRETPVVPWADAGMTLAKMAMKNNELVILRM